MATGVDGNFVDLNHVVSHSSSTSTSATLDPSPPPAAIPPADHPGRSRTLVLCFDGTGDQFDSDNSNIVEFFSMLRKDDRNEQMCYYQAGIGTYSNPEIATPMMAKISKLLDEAVAWNLNAHVMDGYEFLMQNYKAKDRICIFGFSRGAYTARALAGMIHKVGLLPACNHQQIPFAYKMFTDVSELGWKQSNVFKRTFSVDVKIEFIGVWDTVNSVGLIPRRLPFTTSNTIVRTFRHAVALDERRAKFKANLWNRPNRKEQQLGLHPVPVATSDLEQNNHHTDNQEAKVKAKKNPSKKPGLRAMERKYSEEQNMPTDIEEVWFAGCHCDVGGGSVENGTPHSLARIPLRWMIRECFKMDTGIMFTAAGLRTAGLDPLSLYPFVLHRPLALSSKDTHIRKVSELTPPAVPAPAASTPAGDAYPFSSASAAAPAAAHSPATTEEEHELHDAMSPIFDQLRSKSMGWFWWILEYLPMRKRYQEDDNSWAKGFVRNRGEGRRIPKQRKGVVKVHRSVKMRMDAAGGEYHPKASFTKALGLGNVVWVN